MAKWGEGDPRWIVEERPDATNVNNWHWTEKDATQWSKDKLKELFTDLIVEGDVGSCKIVEVSKVEGEASANNRKAKLIFFYEWELQMNWKGTLKDSTKEVKGKIEIPNLSEENSAQEVDVNVIVKSQSDEAFKLKELMRIKGAEIIRARLVEYLDSLKKEFSAGMILPPAKESEGPVKSPKNKSKTTSNQGADSRKKFNEATSDMQKLEIKGVKLTTCKLNLVESFKCTADELYNALTVTEMVQAFTQNPAKLDLKKGGKFELFSGNISGEFLQLVPGKLIEQRWRFKTWPDGHYSVVTLQLNQKSDCTEITLTQTGIPSTDLERTQTGWKHYYWESLKKTFGFGALLI